MGSAALLSLAGRLYRRRLARAIDDRFERGEDGIILGAESIMLHGDSGAAVLLVHGGGDTPQTMRHLARAFHARGYTVAAPLLPGHGRDLEAFDASTADAWYEEVLLQFLRLRATHDWVGVVGLSMGGALSARLAAETQRVDALVLASPYLSMPPAGEILARTSPFWGAVLPVIRTGSDRSVLDPDARATSLGYGAFTRRSLASLRLTAARGFEALPRVAAPTLVMQSTTDNRISTPATQRAFDHIGARQKKLEWIEGAGHIITVDFGWQGVVARAVDWVDSPRPKKKTGRP
ncbi:MAG: alpha/beta fold hydrolase [Gemmatimonadaceae bacterium]